MSVLESATERATAHANATVRLCSAREALWRAQRRHADARGTSAEALAMHCVGEAAAALAMRGQWLHWIEKGTTIRPAEDGEWGVAPEAEEPVNIGLSEPELEGARLAAVDGPRTQRLRSVT
jgi:hypothetical protein